MSKNTDGYFSITYFINSIITIISVYLWELLFSLISIIFLIKKREKSLPFLITWLISFMIFYSFQGFTQLDIEAIRFLIPIIPVICIFIGIDLFIIIERNLDWIEKNGEWN